MIFGSRSNYMLKYQKAKAKLVEYDVDKEDYPDFPLNSNDLSFPTTYIISRFAECVIENNDDVLSELKPLLVKAAQYYDTAVKSQDRQVYDFDFLLTGASAYFFAYDFGSAKVLATKITDDSVISEHSPQKLLCMIFGFLLLNRRMKYLTETDTFSKITNEFLNCFRKGCPENDLLNLLEEYRREIYDSNNPDYVYYVDIMIAIIYKALDSSSWKLLPKYSGEKIEKWAPYLNKSSAIKMLWPAQRLIAEAGILSGKNAIVQLPTGVGKTKSIELIIKSAFISNRAMTVIIVAPLRALCNEITFELSKTFKDEITVNQFSDVLQDDFVLSNGLKKEILVCTPEKLNYVLHHEPDFINQIDLYIFDEGHMFDDGSRGVTYELLASHIKNNLSGKQQLVLLSAVLPNSNEIKDWIFKDNGVLATNADITATPKSIGFASSNRDVVFYSDDIAKEDFFAPGVLKISKLENFQGERAARIFPKLDSPNDIAIYNAMKLCNKGGVAIYIGQQRSMKTVFNRIEELNQRGLDMSPFVKKTNNKELNKLSWLLEQYYGKEHYYTIVSRLGVLPHSSNIPNGVKLAVEDALKKNYIFCVVCTSTLAQGVNIPIKTLLVTSIRNGLQVIKTRNFQNLIGRTARSGMHTEGNIMITDPKIYDNKSSKRGYYVWQECINLFDNNKSEKCSSSILTLVRDLRVDYDTAYSGKAIAEYILKNYDKSDCFQGLAKAINKSYLKKKPNKTQNNIYEEVLFRQNIMVSIENHLCLVMSTNGEDSDKSELAINLCHETLAYYLATDDEKKLLEQLFFKIAGKLSDYSSAQLFNYAQAMSGIDMSSVIEKWIEKSGIIDGYIEEEKLYEMVFDFFITTNGIDNKKQFLTICRMWIDGYTPIDISEAVDIDISEIDSICNKLISYDLNFFIGNICDLIKADEDGNTDITISTLVSLQKKVKYGVATETAVSICEKVFYDRILSMLISDIINDDKVPANKIIRAIEYNKDDVFILLQDFPEYFSDRLNFLLS